MQFFPLDYEYAKRGCEIGQNYYTEYNFCKIWYYYACRQRQLAEIEGETPETLEGWKNLFERVGLHRARIYVVSSGRIGDKDNIAEDIMKRHKKGGMSQARFQRLRLGAIGHFLKEVSEEMVRLFSKENVVKIVLAGPGNAKIMLKDFLPNELKCELLDSIDVDFDEATGYLVSKAEKIIQEDEKETASKNVARLKDEILKHGLAVYGLEDTIDAVKNGRMELLLVSNGYRLRGWICEKCQLFDSGMKDECPNCSGKVAEVDVIEEIIEFAERTGTKIEFIDDNPILQELGGVGGLMRFK